MSCWAGGAEVPLRTVGTVFAPSGTRGTVGLRPTAGLGVRCCCGTHGTRDGPYWPTMPSWWALLAHTVARGGARAAQRLHVTESSPDHAHGSMHDQVSQAHVGYPPRTFTCETMSQTWAGGHVQSTWQRAGNRDKVLLAAINVPLPFGARAAASPSLLTR
jgi:hypothetical protein